ncbi:helix-turn-helix domain-containing protein [Cupriavidus taiwanensis]|uniref:helix-turn-helix domain-containing protein n=1 Tax=Cupriavidus taiwanensis TaxID=164546 RepID=UPI000E180192|nr:helix-turn-helix domain-containing protein [Cupriavidus taiwanensis]SOY48742.1 conserved hypothetical protein [Cupriavidus taiwanensis]SOZ23164.1 conserved hypothetical protein [Cupriavidus taiwanensis]SPA45057.1 conserved hypothetical protein [Cupriavidus taiwanensis]
MKNAPDHEAAESANTQRKYKTNALPKRINTLTAGMLAALLEGQKITGMEAVFKQSTTRAAAVIHYLTHKYGWQIEREDFATGTKDGRVAWVSAYWLTAQAREAAFNAGARAWIDDVKAAAAKRRMRADAVKTKATRLNAMRIDPRQRDLFGGAAW